MVTHCARRAAAVLIGAGLFLWSVSATAADGVHDYPTYARVEFVQECVNRRGGEFEYLYKCSCVIDKFMQELSYDDFVEERTFARYATLSGEGGAIFRDSDAAKAKAKRYGSVEAAAYRACGMEPR